MFYAYGTRASTDGSKDPFSGYGAQWGYYTDSETVSGSGTGLELSTFRYYDPANGRFVNRDPIGYDGGVNLYNYTHHSPTKAFDSSGLQADADSSGAEMGPGSGDGNNDPVPQFFGGGATGSDQDAAPGLAEAGYTEEVRDLENSDDGPADGDPLNDTSSQQSRSWRLVEFFKRLDLAPEANCAQNAMDLVNDTLNDVEDDYSGEPFEENPGLKRTPRMYGPKPDQISQNDDGSLTGTTRGHIITASPNGGIDISLKDGTVQFTKSGGG